MRASPQVIERVAGDAPGLDVRAVREQFPILHQQVHGKPLVYLDNAASVQKPRAVIEAVSECYERYYANIHRGVHALSERSTAAYEAAREKVRAFLGAASAREIIFVRGTTEAINLVASSYARPRLTPGDEILITHMEHHSNIVPWQLVCEQTGAELRVVPVSEAGEIDLEDYQRLLGERTRLVSVTHVSNVLGTINPIRQMVALAHARGIPVLVDGAQSAPHMPVDVSQLGCDFYAFSGHKVYGPSGIGVLYGREALLDAMPPYQGGGSMISRVSFQGTRFAELPQKFEAGTPNIAGAIGLGATVDWVQALGTEAIAAHEHAVLEFATAELEAIEGLRIVGTAADKAGVVSFVLEGAHPHDIATILDREGVAVRAGHHCAQPLMERFGVAATVRASLAAYNSFEDIEALVRGLRKVREMFC